MTLGLIADAFLIVILAMTAFVIINALVAFVRHRIRRGKLLTDLESNMVRNAAKRDAYEDIARFASEYYNDPNFSSRIRQLYYTKDLCPECDGKGKKWQNSKDKCEHCWGTGKHLKDF